MTEDNKSAGTHEHHLREHKKTAQVINRLSRAEGHVRAIKRMLEEGRPCPDVLIQLAAVRAAIDRAARIVLEDHLESCVRQAAIEGNVERELEELRQALNRFMP